MSGYKQILLLVLSCFFISWTSVKDACTCPNKKIDPIENFCRNTNLKFIENKGQWMDNIHYQCELGGLNAVYLEENSFTYVIHDNYKASELHEVIKASKEIKESHLINGHRYSVEFLNAKTPVFSGHNKRSALNNYFNGNEKDKWGRKVGIYSKVQYNQLYENIHLSVYGEYGDFKYDFIVDPGGNPSNIELKYTGQDSIYIENGDLVIKTSVIDIREIAPYAYQVINGIQKKIPCHYLLNDNVLSFSLPESYNKNYPLIIDPTVIGATLTGSTGNMNFGHSAAFDNAGNMYMAGISFGIGYPTTDGAFQENYTDKIDMVVSKYNQDGSELLYATYLGGDSGDYPYSIITDGNGQLYILGATNSMDYPISENAFQKDHAGITDIVISILSSEGDDLVGSTFVGGSGEDGVNQSDIATIPGSAFRGEIIVDENSNIYIATCSNSNDFPTTPNAFQEMYYQNGSMSQDAVLMKLNADVSTLFWATYLGGDGIDMCNALRLDSQGNIYAAGFAGDASFPMYQGNGVQKDWPGSEKTSFLVKMSSDGSTMLAGTYWGTEEPDEGSFIDIDEDGQIHMYGTSLGSIPITPDTYYFNEDSRQYITGFSSDLSTVLYSTVIGFGGDSNGFEYLIDFDFSPVAFMVDNCNNIYFSGYYASEGLPTTSDALSTDGNSFYLAALSPLAKDLSFGTYYGKSNHVDGGTSRFDKAGIIYQGVCSCTNQNILSGGVMNTTSSAWATDQTVYCDAGIFKIDFELSIVTASGFSSTTTSGCAPFNLDLKYTGQDATSVFWDFGNGDTSSEFNPSYTFEEAGTYTITQIAENPNSCNLQDTFLMEVNVLNGNSTVTEVGICDFDNGVFLDATTLNASYNWNTNENQSTINVNEVGIYWVDISIEGCTQRDSFIVSSADINYDILNSTYDVCEFSDFTLDVSNEDAAFYTWSDGSNEPSFEIEESGIYKVTVSLINGCKIVDSTTVSYYQVPEIELGENVVLCTGETKNLTISSADIEIEWQDGSTSENYLVSEPGMYTVTITTIDGCLMSDSINIDYENPIDLDLGENTTLCTGESFILDIVYSDFDVLWQNGSTSQEFLVNEAGNYSVTLTSKDGCEYIDSINISYLEKPNVDLGEDITLCDRDSFILKAEFPQWDIQWQDGSSEQEFIVNEAGNYAVTVSNFDCESTASVEIFYNPAPEVLYDTYNVLCAGEKNGEIISYSINGGDDIEFQWNTEETSSDLLNVASGQYSVTISNEFDCFEYQEFTIVEPLPIEYNIFLDNTPCVENSLASIFINNISGGSAPFIFTSIGDSTINEPLFENLPPNTYEIEIQDANGCSVSEEIIIENYKEVLLNAGEDKFIYLGESASLIGFSSEVNNVIFQWSPNYNLSCSDCLITEASPEFDTDYILSVEDTSTGCIYYDTVNVSVDRSLSVFIPNTFTPNNDGINDIFTVFGNNSLKIIRNIQVYDRWGEMVYNQNNVLPNDPTVGWDGTFKNKPLNSQILVYIVEAEFLDGSVEIIRGDITLMN